MCYFFAFDRDLLVAARACGCSRNLFGRLASHVYLEARLAQWGAVLAIDTHSRALSNLPYYIKMQLFLKTFCIASPEGYLRAGLLNSNSDWNGGAWRSDGREGLREVFRKQTRCSKVGRQPYLKYLRWGTPRGKRAQTGIPKRRKAGRENSGRELTS